VKIPALNESELAPFLNREELIILTTEQIKKDFDLFNVEIKFSGNSEKAYEELFSQIEPFITKLINTNYEKLLSVLYKIDVSEKRISEVVNKSKNISDEITRLIIFRELQKVIIKKHYNSLNE